MDETRELIEIDDDDEQPFYTYCYCTKSLFEMRQKNLKYCFCGACVGPFLFVADVIALVPQIFINNVKLCLR